MYLGLIYSFLMQNSFHRIDLYFKNSLSDHEIELYEIKALSKELSLPDGIVLQDVGVAEVGPLPFVGKLLCHEERPTPTPT